MLFRVSLLICIFEIAAHTPYVCIWTDLNTWCIVSKLRMENKINITKSVQPHFVGSCRDWGSSGQAASKSIICIRRTHRLLHRCVKLPYFVGAFLQRPITHRQAAVCITPPLISPICHFPWWAATKLDYEVWSSWLVDELECHGDSGNGHKTWQRCVFSPLFIILSIFIIQHMTDRKH